MKPIPYDDDDSNGYDLILAPPSALAVCEACGGSNGNGLVDKLEDHPLSKAERAKGRGRGYDHPCLQRYNGTDFCQWHGRSGDGRFYAVGRIMQIVRKATPNADH